MIEFYVNQSLKAENNWNNVTTYGDVTVYNDSGAYSLAFENEVVVKISASFEFKLMTFTVVMSPDLSGNVNGLLGKFRCE